MTETPAHPEPTESTATAVTAEPAAAAEPVTPTAGEPAAAQEAAGLSPAAVAALLAERFPRLFGAGRALPIKLRVQADIQQRAPGVFSKKSLSVFLHRYTTSTAYLKALANAPQRLDLDGEAAGEVDEVHRQAAAAEVQRRQQIVAERRAAERDQQRLAAAEARQAQTVRAAQNAARHSARQAAQQGAEQEAQRQRAVLLRAFETTTLTVNNFCALKGLQQADLEMQLAQARGERDQRALAPTREPRREPRDSRPTRAAHGPAKPPFKPAR